MTVVWIVAGILGVALVVLVAALILYMKQLDAKITAAMKAEKPWYISDSEKPLVVVNTRAVRKETK